jgi:hypothetical protein
VLRLSCTSTIFLAFGKCVSAKSLAIISLTPQAPYDVGALAPADDSAGVGAPGNEIEITPEMIEAGYEVLASRYFDLVDSFGYR